MVLVLVRLSVFWMVFIVIRFCVVLMNRLLILFVFVVRWLGWCF